MIVLVLAALYGAALTLVAAHPLGLPLSLALAPFGGSLVALLAALVLYLRPRPHGYTRQSAPIGCS
jgi:hypothetical protein